MCVAKWSWGSKSKPFVCSSLKSVSKSRQDEMRYTFDVAKCDRIFDYLLQEKQIKFPSGHVIKSSEQLKKHAYCKWHNLYSHAINDCNVFHQQVQSVINEGRLKFAESPQNKPDKDPFPANKNKNMKPQQCPKATFDILMAMYKESRASIRGHENRTIRNTKLDSLVSMGQASTSTTGSPFCKRS
jgi:hypothetical protein